MKPWELIQRYDNPEDAVSELGGKLTSGELETHLSVDGSELERLVYVDKFDIYSAMFSLYVDAVFEYNELYRS